MLGVKQNLKFAKYYVAEWTARLIVWWKLHNCHPQILSYELAKCVCGMNVALRDLCDLPGNMEWVITALSWQKRKKNYVVIFLIAIKS